MQPVLAVDFAVIYLRVLHAIVNFVKNDQKYETLESELKTNVPPGKTFLFIGRI